MWAGRICGAYGEDRCVWGFGDAKGKKELTGKTLGLDRSKVLKLAVDWIQLAPVMDNGRVAVNNFQGQGRSVLNTVRGYHGHREGCSEHGNELFRDKGRAVVNMVMNFQEQRGGLL